MSSSLPSSLTGDNWVTFANINSADSQVAHLLTTGTLPFAEQQLLLWNWVLLVSSEAANGEHGLITQMTCNPDHRQGESLLHFARHIIRKRLIDCHIFLDQIGSCHRPSWFKTWPFANTVIICEPWSNWQGGKLNSASSRKIFCPRLSVRQKDYRRSAEDKTRYSHISEDKTAWERTSVDHPRQQASCENLRSPSDVCMTEQDPMPHLFLNERNLSAFRVSSIPIRALVPLEKISDLR